MDSTNLTHTILGMMSTAIAGLVAALAVLWSYTKKLNKVHSDEQKENITTIVQAMAGNTKALEGNTKVLDEMQKLVHSVNERIIKMDAENGKHG